MSMSTYLPFRLRRALYFGSLLVYYNTGVLACADARLGALAKVKGVSRG